MAYNYEYPYTDPHRYNDDWMLNTIRQIASEWKNLDVQDEVDKKLEEMVTDGTLGAILIGYVTPQMYGAKGDGSTDDTDAIKEALNVSLQTKKPLFFPSGDYKISSQLEVNSHITIFGTGEKSRIVCGNFNCFYVTSSCVIRDIAIQGGLLGIDGTAGIYIESTNFVELYNLFINDCYDCIRFNGTCFYCTISNLKFYRCINAFIRTSGDTYSGHQIIMHNITMSSAIGTWGFYLENIGTIILDEIELSPTNLIGGSMYIGSLSDGSGISQFTNVRLEGADNCIVCEANEIRYFYFSQCYLYGKLSFKKLKDCFFSNCYFTGSNTIEVSNCIDVQINNSDFQINADPVIRLSESVVRFNQVTYGGINTFINGDGEIWVSNSQIGESVTPILLTDITKLHITNCNTSNYTVSKLIKGKVISEHKILFETGITLVPKTFYGVPIDGNATQLNIRYWTLQGANVVCVCSDTLTVDDEYDFYIYANIN